MGSKGLSPLIAVIIMIGIAVVVGGILSSWVTSFVSGSARQDTCAITTMYTLSEATYNASSGIVKVKVKNMGSVSLRNFSVEADNGTLIARAPASFPDPSYSVGSGMAQYVVANASNSSITNVVSITVLTESCKGYSPVPVEVGNI
ncbi:MAG: archaellin/type IV pilin N-terminal domain-containing protein [Candidatus Aenigmatarchaeota archaeon]